MELAVAGSELCFSELVMLRLSCVPQTALQIIRVFSWRSLSLLCAVRGLFYDGNTHYLGVTKPAFWCLGCVQLTGHINAVEEETNVCEQQNTEPLN